MATFTDARLLSAHQKARARRLKEGYTSIDAATRAGAEIVQADAVKLTSGATRTQKQLRQAGHPFARSGGRLGRIGQVFQAFPLLPIGQMSGDLKNKWRVFARAVGSETVYRLQNMSPQARFVLSPGGTSRMVDRGFWRELNRVTQEKVKRKRLELWRAALKG